MPRLNDGTIIINDLQKGVSSSPLGFQEIRNLNIFDKPGIVEVNPKLTKESSTTVEDYIKKYVRVPNSSTYESFAIDASNNLYGRSNSGTYTKLGYSESGTGSGLEYFKGYALIFRNNAIDYIGQIFGSSLGSFVTSWKSFDDGDSNHPSLVGQDGVVYIGDGRYIASLEENTGQTFDPTNAATYTYNSQALDLPAGYSIIALAEQRQYLAILAKNEDEKKVKVFLWDRVSASYVYPLDLNESNAYSMINAYGTLVIHAGRGKFYKTDGINVSFLGQIPETLLNLRIDAEISPIANSMMVFKDRIFFTIKSSVAGPICAVYSITLDGRITIENTISTGNSNSTVIMGALFPISQVAYLVGWKDTTSGTQGADIYDTNARYTSGAYFITDFYRIGDPLFPYTFSSAMVDLANNLATGQSITLEYRYNNNDDWTTIKQFDYATFGAKSKFEYGFGASSENIQFRVSLASDASSRDSLQLLTTKFK